MEETIFTKIIKGDIPSHKVYEDDKTFAFLDIHPSQPGHTLVIPKAQVEFLWDLGDEDYAAVMDTVKKVAQRLKNVMGTSFVGVKVVGVDVPHAHVHLVPFNTASEFHKIADMSLEPNHAELAELAKKLAF